jgi:hypothetical protein
MRFPLPEGRASVKRHLAFTAIVGAFAGLFAFAQGAPAFKVQPPSLSARLHGKVVPAALGSYCLNGPASGMCGDAAYPLQIRKRLEVSPGDQLSLLVGSQVARVEVSLVRVAGNDIDPVAQLRARPASPAHRRWLTRLPRNLQNAGILDVSVQYEANKGDADFWVGLRANREAD